jgi:hypothetical protein
MGINFAAGVDPVNSSIQGGVATVVLKTEQDMLTLINLKKIEFPWGPVRCFLIAKPCRPQYLVVLQTYPFILLQKI